MPACMSERLYVCSVKILPLPENFSFKWAKNPHIQYTQLFYFVHIHSITSIYLAFVCNISLMVEARRMTLCRRFERLVLTGKRSIFDDDCVKQTLSPWEGLFQQSVQPLCYNKDQKRVTDWRSVLSTGNHDIRISNRMLSDLKRLLLPNRDILKNFKGIIALKLIGDEALKECNYQWK